MIKQAVKDRFKPQLLTMMIICGALIMGATTFAILISTITDWTEVGDPSSPSMLALMGLIFGGMMVMLSFIVPIVSRRANIRQLTDRYASPDLYEKSKPSLGEDDGLIHKLLATFQTSMIIRFAMIEGAVFLNLMLFMVERNPINLIVGGVGLLIMLAMLPLPGRVWNWVESTIEGMENHARGR